MRAIQAKCLVVAAIILTVACNLSISGVVAVEELAPSNLSATATPTAGELVSSTPREMPSQMPGEVVSSTPRPTTQADNPQRMTAKAETPTELVVGLAGISLSATEVAIASTLVVALVIGLALVLWKLR